MVQIWSNMTELGSKMVKMTEIGCKMVQILLFISNLSKFHYKMENMGLISIILIVSTVFYLTFWSSIEAVSPYRLNDTDNLSNFSR